MKKIIIFLALCTGMLAGTVVQAQKVELKPDTPEVVFKAKTTPNTMGIYFIVEEGVDINDEGADDKIYAVKHATSGPDGKIEFTFAMPEDKKDNPDARSDGRYDIYIKEENQDKVKADVQLVYASEESRSDLLQDIKDIQFDGTETQQVQDILDEHSLVLEAIGCMTEFGNTETAANIAQALSDPDINLSKITLSEFKETHNESVIDDNASATEILNALDPVFEGEKYSDIKMYNEDLNTWLLSYFTKFEYSQENYACANILYKFNTCAAEGIDALFETYSVALEITTEDAAYKTYYGKTETEKLAINRTLTNILMRTPANDKASLLAALSKAVSNPTIAGGSSGGNSGGGNSGGGGGGVASVPAAVPSGGNASGLGIKGFKDLDNAEWARTAVTSLANAGIVSGDENGNFRPNDYVTREEYVKMLVVAAGKLNIYATCEFKDVPKDAWYHSYVASAKQYGLTSGINEEEFGTGRELTRQDMAVLSLNAKGDVLKVREDIAFSDGNKIAGYAKNAVSKLYMSGAVNGTGNNKFEPLGKATRAECAQIIYNLFLK